MALRPKPAKPPVESFPEKAVKTGKASLVIVSEEASDNTKKMFSNMCTYYKVPLYMLGEKEELGHAMGRRCVHL